MQLSKCQRLLLAVHLLILLDIVEATVDFRGHFLHIISEDELTKSLPDAKAFCKTIGAVIPNDLKEGDADYYHQLMVKNNHAWGIWLDVVKKGNEFTFTGSKRLIQASEWMPGEPACTSDDCHIGLYNSDDKKLFAVDNNGKRFARVLCIADVSNFSVINALHEAMGTLAVADQLEIRKRFQTNLDLTWQVGVFMDKTRAVVNQLMKQMVQMSDIKDALIASRARIDEMVSDEVKKKPQPPPVKQQPVNATLIHFLDLLSKRVEVLEQQVKYCSANATSRDSGSDAESGADSSAASDSPQSDRPQSGPFTA